MSKRSVDNPLALVVMGLLAEQAMHPYQMAAVLRDRRKDTTVRINRGSLYDVVAALEREGWITAQATERAGTRPPRTVYALTTAGWTEFVARLDRQVRRPQREFPQFLSVVSYLGALGREGALAALRERAQRWEAAIDEDQRALDEVLSGGRVPRLHVIEAEYALHMARSELGWINDIAEEVHSGALEWPRDFTAGQPETGNASEGERA